MPDVFTRAKRSEVMSKIRGRRNLSTEMRMIVGMKAVGIKGWRRHQPLPGRPDFVFPREKVAVFVDGCFWHGCPKHYIAPRSSVRFWREKIAANMKRDRRINRELRARGWTVIRVWEHDLKRGGRADRILENLAARLAAPIRRPDTKR